MSDTTGGRGAGRGPLGSELTSLRFAAVARRLSETARELGVASPAFRSPPRRPGCRRTIRWERDGSATVSVALRGRPAVAAANDMIDGVVAAGRLQGTEAATTRDGLWAALAQLFEEQEDDGSRSVHKPGRRTAA